MHRSTHIVATVAHGATGAIVGTTNTQTLTNKTIDSASNTMQVSGTNINSLINQDVRSTASNNATVTTLTTSAPAGTPGDINMPAVTKNRKIVLYPGFVNDHQFYGLGVNANVLRFQVDQTATSFVFYTGTSSTTSNEVFRVLGTGGVQFPNSASGYTPSALSYYEEGSFTANFTGAATTNQTIRFTRVGNQVTLQIPAFTAAFSSSAPLSAGAAIPARLRPTTGDHDKLHDRHPEWQPASGEHLLPGEDDWRPDPLRHPCWGELQPRAG